MNLNKSHQSKRLRTETLTDTLTGLCEIYDKTISSMLGTIWKNMFADFSEEEFLNAVKRYLVGPDAAFFPKPGQIYNLARPEENKDSEASLLVEVLFRVVSSCGDDKEGVANAKRRLPDIVWSYVENVGGWAKFSRDMQLIDSGDTMTSKSQIRKSIVALMDRKKQGRSLIVQNEAVALSPIGDVRKLVLEGFKNVPIEARDGRERNDKENSEGSQ